MRPISRDRFNALAMYTRGALLRALAHELAWFEHADGLLVGVLILDSDGEYSGQILARDLRDRYRWVGATEFVSTPEAAVQLLGQRFSALMMTLTTMREQGDEQGPPVDFFKPIVDESKIHASFKQLASGDAFGAARKIISLMMRWHEDVDGNFIEQFQTTGFDARLWELYLFAAMTEAGFDVERPVPAPDFIFNSLAGRFALEATTINPSSGAEGSPTKPERPTSATETMEYLQNYLPIRYAGPLTAKLAKKYWLRPEVVGLPFVIAIQDFHSTLSMTYSGSALPTYLYGYVHEVERGETEGAFAVSKKIAEHRWGSKTVPSGFFSLPESENISAVLFNSSGTLSKFNRMGVKVGFGVENVILIRHGFAIDTSPDALEPRPFEHVVDYDYPETWMEGMNVYHNPNAKLPLDPEILSGAVHHRLMSDGQVETTSAVNWMPLGSTTSIVVANVATSRTDDQQNVPK